MSGAIVVTSNDACLIACGQTWNRGGGSNERILAIRSMGMGSGGDGSLAISFGALAEYDFEVEGRSTPL